jgi:aminopeptidase-like protein
MSAAIQLRSFRESSTAFDPLAAGERMFALIEQLFPICRSITGNGVRETLAYVRERIPLETQEIPTGTPVFDWTIPNEWNIRDAWIKNAAGDKVVDFQRSNLHVVNYSAPVHKKMTLSELRPHLHTLPERPDDIPYRTSYYNPTWGFCLSQRDLEGLPEGEYEVCIDSTLAAGSLTYGECVLPGKREEEILISCHVCHPSLANDNLSGVALTAALGEWLLSVEHEYTYRLLFIPGTIGSIAWLSRNEHQVHKVRHGLVVACVGDGGKFHYKHSRRGNAAIDRAVVRVFAERGVDLQVRDFTPYGYDERQYCSPGFNLPVGSLTRTPHGQFPEYHTSADNLKFITPAALGHSLAMYLAVLEELESSRKYLNQNPHCEPQLGKRGLYRALGGFAEAGQLELAMLWVLNQSDGEHSLADIAEQSQLSREVIDRAAELLTQSDLLTPCH